MPTSRFTLSLAVLLMGCTALSGGAQAGWLDFGSKSDKPAADKKAVVKKDDVQPAPTLDGSIRQAQLLRLAGQYPEAIKHLSQLMMVASDDGRVVSEYGKTLAAMGRAQEAVNFLGRATQLMPDDWSVYSAMGVALDQMSRPQEAQTAYEHALSLKPGEPSVLNNYALSRMLAKDPEGAKKLISRAEIAGGASDPKIARNIAMIREMAPDAADKSFAVTTPAPSPVPHAVAMAPQAAPRTPVAQRPMPQAVASNQSAPFVNIPQPPAPTSAPRQLVPSGVINAAPPQFAQMPSGGVVMQRVPVDPMAGPVLPKVAVARAPRTAKAEAPKPEKQAAAPTPVKTAATEALDLQAKADAIAKQLAAKPQAKAAVLAAASKPDGADSKAGPVTAKLVVKAEAAKPTMAKPEARPVKTADAKPKAAKDTIPGLRLSANAY